MQEPTRLEYEALTNLYRSIFAVVDLAVFTASKQIPPDEELRDGGWFLIREMDDDAIISDCTVRIGTLNAHSRKSILHVAEKANRLSEHCRGNTETKTSRQIPCPPSHESGGAVRVGNYILSFSGLPESWDEAVVLYAAYQCRLISLGFVETIASPTALDGFSHLEATCP